MADLTDEARRIRNRKKNEANVRRYKKRRRALIKKMGGCCERCGSRRKIEFHHPNGRDWDCKQLSRWARISRYERDFESGELELLCRKCNAGINPKRDGTEDEGYDYINDDEIDCAAA